jgi:hypothetical protein
VAHRLIIHIIQLPPTHPKKKRRERTSKKMMQELAQEKNYGSKIDAYPPTTTSSEEDINPRSDDELANKSKNSTEEESKAAESEVVAGAGPEKRGPNWRRYRSKKFPNAGQGKGGVKQRRERITGIDQPVSINTQIAEKQGIVNSKSSIWKTCKRGCFGIISWEDHFQVSEHCRYGIAGVT